MWLIDTLSIQPLNLVDIQKKWLNASANEDGDALTERSFNRYRRDTEALMYVDIMCDKRNGNIYEIIRPEGFKKNDLQEWLLSAFRISNLADHANKREDIMIEAAPPASYLLQTVMDAIDRKQTLEFHYKSHYKDVREVTLIPVFVRLFKQRWYVIGEDIEKHRCMTCALERISGVNILTEKVHLAKDLAKILTPTKYFEHCFGIIRQYEPLKIRFRAFWPQDAYLKDVPIHSSQTEIVCTENYTDFEIYVRPTYDLKQEFLWHRDKLSILAPESFRQDMIAVAKAVVLGYETGNNHSINE